MNVNTPSRVNLRTVEDRVRAVFTTLKLAPGDMALRRQVGTFITCNGYQSVLRAAQLTAKQAEREDIADPWAYTIAVYNGNLARLSHLYTLTHWVENGLRSQFDLHYGATLGATWHRFPDQYLPRDSPANFLSLHASMGVESRDVPWSDRGRPRKEITRPADAALFLETVTFGWLLTMVRYLHSRTQGRGILMTAAGRFTSPQQARALLDTAKMARNVVAHNHYLDTGRYESHRAELSTLLEILHFDVIRALTRTEAIRADIVTAHIRSARR